MKTDEQARGYAKAFLEIALVENLLGETEQELFAISNTVKNNLKLKEVFEGKVVDVELKKKILNEVFQGKISQLTLGFLMLLVDSGKEKMFTEVVKAFSTGVASKRDMVVAEVVSAVPLDEKAIAGLKKMLEDKFEKQVELRPRVKEEILGGFIVKIGDKLIDASLKNKLDLYKKEIKAE